MKSMSSEIDFYKKEAYVAPEIDSFRYYVCWMNTKTGQRGIEHGEFGSTWSEAYEMALYYDDGDYHYVGDRQANPVRPNKMEAESIIAHLIDVGETVPSKIDRLVFRLTGTEFP